MTTISEGSVNSISPFYLLPLVSYGERIEKEWGVH